MIARLMNRESYQRNLVTKAYCSRMLTRLLKNYRSHPDIIGISNDLFYNGELQPSASVDKTHCYLGWRKLPNIKVPIIFDITLGKAVKEENSVRYLSGNRFIIKLKRKYSPFVAVGSTKLKLIK